MINKYTTKEKLTHIERIKNFEENNYPEKILLDYIQDADSLVRQEAITCVWEYFSDSNLVDKIMELSLQDEDITVRENAIIGLGRIIYEGDFEDYESDEDIEEAYIGDTLIEPIVDRNLYFKVKNFLLKLIKDETVPLTVRRKCLESLSYIGYLEEIKKLIFYFYNMPEEESKISAIFAMGQGTADAWGNYILFHLDDPSNQIKIEAIRAAGNMELIKAKKKILDLCYDDDSIIQEEAMLVSPKVFEDLEDARYFLNKIQGDFRGKRDLRTIVKYAFEILKDLEMMEQENDFWEDFDDDDFDDDEDENDEDDDSFDFDEDEFLEGQDKEIQDDIDTLVNSFCSTDYIEKLPDIERKNIINCVSDFLEFLKLFHQRYPDEMKPILLSEFLTNFYKYRLASMQLERKNKMLEMFKSFFLFMGKEGYINNPSTYVDIINSLI